ncbi:molybdopterin binding protein [Rhizophagus clarus]|uniref:Molybdopterin binding protein n=1 Tax=Rhizophagus clarus TaxID=94130 RepID=A0A8H3MHK6_9GLOM|nr:molybdopterin binding protein [Rhizophagus clarus]
MSFQFSFNLSFGTRLKFGGQLYLISIIRNTIISSLILKSNLNHNRRFHGTSYIRMSQSKEKDEENKDKKNEKDKFILPITPITDFKNKPYPKTAACLIIGDEILNGKTVDTNSSTFAKYCFDHGIDLKRIEVIPDEEDTIIRSVKYLSDNFDFVITSGGIGPTHDDITYPSIAKAYNLPLKHHQLTYDRMNEFTNYHSSISKYMKSPPGHEAIEATKRMSLFPDPSIVIYPDKTLWVPIVIVNENIHILPGIPRLFKSLLFNFSTYLKVRQDGNKGENFYRRFVKTFQPESFIAPVLTEVQEKVKDIGIKVGSYPRFTPDKRWVIVVSFLTRENNKDKVEELCKEVAEKTNGIIIDSEDAIIAENENKL